MEPSIQFVEQTAPSAQSDAQNSASTHNAIGGVVRLRSRTQSISRSVDYSKSGDYECAEDEDAGLRNEGDYKRSQVRDAWANAVHKVSRADQ